MSETVSQFYDRLADDYHLLFADWKEAVLWQAQVLDKLIRAETGKESVSLLDCSCGIGTQAIGLATRGHRVHATDLSAEAIRRARREAKAFGAQVTFGIADFRDLEVRVPGTFEAVISCDNALPHLLADDDLLLAARNMAAKLEPKGLLLLSIRDYDQLVKDKPGATAPRVFDTPEGRRIVFQVWDWAHDGKMYQVHQFILTESEGEWKTAHYATVYRALLRVELEGILSRAGFSDIRWHTPEESGYYQPIVTARRA
jgi:glycine/sarcosine N-methyltransferase